MNETAERIAERLEASFTAHGFAKPGVDILRAEADVSLRTLYRHFPSREAMVIGALDHRHRVYLAYLADGVPAGPGAAPVLHMFERLGDWMAERAPTGCLFVSALAAHPDSAAIRAAVARHKRETRGLIGERVACAAPASRRERFVPLLDALLLVHEGQTTMAVTSGADAATKAAVALATACLADWRIT